MRWSCCRLRSPRSASSEFGKISDCQRPLLWAALTPRHDITVAGSRLRSSLIFVLDPSPSASRPAAALDYGEISHEYLRMDSNHLDRYAARRTDGAAPATPRSHTAHLHPLRAPTRCPRLLRRSATQMCGIRRRARRAGVCPVRYGALLAISMEAVCGGSSHSRIIVCRGCAPSFAGFLRFYSA